MTDKTVWLVESGEKQQKADWESVYLTRKKARMAKWQWEQMDDNGWASITEMELSPVDA